MPTEPLQYQTFTREEGSERQFLDIAGLLDAEARELRPSDPHPTVSELADEIAAGWWSTRRTGFVVASRGGEPVGYARWRLDVEDDPEGVQIGAYVLPAERRQRLGSTLVASALDEAEDRHSVTRSDFWVRQDSPLGRELSGFVEDRWSLPVKMVERVARLDLTGREHAPVAAELAARLARHTEHEAVFFEMDDVPGTIALEDYAALMEEIMNLMPFEGLEAYHESYTPARFQEGVAAQRRVGRTLWHLVMVERATRRPVAVTVISFRPSDARLIEQWDTGVAAVAQGRGLGKTAKLWMLEKVLRELPEAWFIETENAHSNAAMIAINDALGFREHAIGHAYQLPAADLRRLLGRSRS